MTAHLAHWRRNQAAITLATFVGFMAFTLVMPFLPLYFEQLGIHDPAEISIWSGVSLGITPAITAAMAPVWARVAERYGRKLMVVRSLSFFIVSMVVMAFIWRPWHVFALRAALGFFAGYGSVVMTMAAESAPPGQTATALGWVQTAQRLGPAMGPVIGGSLAQAVGLRHAFLWAAGFYVVAVALVAFGYRDTHVSAPDPDLAERTSFRSMRLVPHFMLFMGMVFGLQLVDRSFGPVLPLYLREIGFTAARVPFLSGVIFTTAAGSAAVGNQISGWLLSRSSARQLVSGMSLLAGVGFAIFSMASSLTWLLAGAVLFGLPIGIATTTLYTVASQAVPRGTRGVVFGYLSTAYLAALAVSPVVSGFIGAVNVRTVFIIDAIGLAALGLFVRRRMAL